LLENLHKGFIMFSSSFFASPVLFVAKPNSSLRFCIDYCKLNSLTKKDQHLLLLINKTLVWITNVKIFIKLNICQAFYHIHIDVASKELITFQTRYNTYKYQVLLFSLTNGLIMYQKYINKVLFNYLDDFCIIYLNNILIYSDNVLKYKHYIKLVL
jgi:hypothetical protein